MTAQENRVRRKRSMKALALISMCISSSIAFGTPAASAQATRPPPAAGGEDGRALFAKCSACHALTPGHNGRGPTLYHLFGRKAGSVPGYDYSPAMRRAGIVWREDSLARFIADPEHVVPGTTMRFSIRVSSQQTRALIDYLRAMTR